MGERFAPIQGAGRAKRAQKNESRKRLASEVKALRLSGASTMEIRQAALRLMFGK